MNFYLKQFQTFFFVSYPRYLIEVFRILFYLFLFFYYFQSNEVQGYLNLNEVYWKPTGLFNFLEFIKPPLELPGVFSVLWKSSLLFCGIGLFANYFKWPALVLSLFFLGYTSNFYLFTADTIIVTYILLIFSFCNFGQALSLDKFILKNSKALGDSVPAWTIRFIQITYVACWFGSGIQKLRLSGLDWVFVNHLQFFTNTNPVGSLLPAEILQAGLGLTLILELSSPLIFYKKLRPLYLATMFGFHLVSMASLNLPLLAWLVGFIFWIEPKKMQAS